LFELLIIYQLLNLPDRFHSINFTLRRRMKDWEGEGRLRFVMSYFSVINVWCAKPLLYFCELQLASFVRSFSELVFEVGDHIIPIL